MILDKHLLNEQRNEGRNLHVLPVGSRTSYSPRCVLTYEETITRASNIFLPCWGGFDWLDNGRKCKHRKSTKIQTVKNCLCLRRKRWLETVRPHRAIKVQSENECTRVHTHGSKGWRRWLESTRNFRDREDLIVKNPIQSAFVLS